jgi:hypothetical protein
VIERVVVGVALFCRGARMLPAFAVFLDRPAVRVRLSEHGAGSGFGCALALLSLMSGLFSRRTLADPAGRALSKSELGLQVGRPLCPLLEPRALALGNLGQTSLFGAEGLPGSLPLASR